MKDKEGTMNELNSKDIANALQANVKLILEENKKVADKIEYSQIASVIPFIQNAERIFLIGAGRSGLALRSAAMRLMHLGLTVFVVGEITTPAIGKGDLLIAASGSGTTSSIVKAAEKAVAAEAKVIALSTTATSPLAELAMHVAVIPAAQKQDHGTTISEQYAGSLFEQFILLLTDAIFQTLWSIDGTPAEELWKRHANLE
ncbi:6-phospho-3-hexuloisomerase [Pontibacter silvestris]|uniref:6-phospho-3-hexuloisomerase n=1 Tax=Pontibacter silvestris TaxID=2305183 RepID=A0ABW4X3F5_9BACT|nr:6-phospho-3-hexuloisomerase [Pontibacter silvestris]MCC9138348.1 6-phospho-3-hexuloisomerase [Pontibacter silvestris]